MLNAKTVYVCLLDSSRALSVADIAKETGAAKHSMVSCHLFSLRKKGLIKNDQGRWSVLKRIDPDTLRTIASGAGSSKRTPGQAAFDRFKKALEEMMNTAIEIQNFVMMENEREELSTLREWKRQIEEAAAKFKRK